MAAFAADPVIVNISGVTDRINTSVTGGYGTGVLNWNFNTSTGTHIATTTMIGITGGDLTMGALGIDTTVCHPGVVGEVDKFQAIGAFTATYSTQTNGNYGILSGYVNASSGAGGAQFQLSDTQNFHIMSGNWPQNLVGIFVAQAFGNNNQVAMNIQSSGSMYCWSEATVPYSAPELQGSSIYKGVATTLNAIPTTSLSVGVVTDGLATSSNSIVQWGMGNSDSGTLSTTHYGGGTQSVTATGNGTYIQLGFGANDLNFNGFNLGAGNAQLIINFLGGVTGAYTMDAK
jgi:hypothetical protein